MAPAVQGQLRTAHAAMRAVVTNPASSATEKAAAYGDLGKLLFAAEYYDLAAESFRSAESLDRGDGRWPYYLAQVHAKNGEPEEAASGFERARALLPGDVAVLVALGDAHLAAGRPDAAEGPYGEALSRSPRNAAALAGLGRTALARRDFPRAVQMLGDALASDPSATSLHYPLSTAYRWLGDTANADAHLARRGAGVVMQDDPRVKDLDLVLESAPSYEVRGAAAMNAGDWAGAAAAFRRSTELAPDNAMLQHRLGTALALAGDLTGAVAAFEEALRRNPRLARARLSLGVLLESTGDRERALAELRAAVRDDPEYVEGHLRLAEVLRQSGRLAEARPHYARAVALDPHAGPPRLGLATLLVDLAQYAAARDLLDEGMRLRPDLTGLAHALSRILSAAPVDRVRDGQRALTIADTLAAREPAGADAAETTAMALAELGRFDDAVQWQRQAIASAERSGRLAAAQRMGESLERFERRTPARVPWAPDAAFLAD